jgi:uncharacterized low-complexity protein
MKKIAISSAIAGFLLLSLASEASAWYCEARSATGAWGWGRSYSLARAKRIALYQCARRTPRRFVCYITGCL